MSQNEQSKDEVEYVIYTPDTNGDNILPKDQFYPNPYKLFSEVVEKQIGGTTHAILHGSFVYLDDGPTNFTYHETRVYQADEFINSRFELRRQPPDVDVILIVEDLEEFDAAFEEYSDRLEITSNLNHFLEITVITPEILRSEIQRNDPSGMKRVFGMKPIKSFGDIALIEGMRTLATDCLTETDRQYQREYDQRKTLYRSNGLAGVTSFQLERTIYEQDYPELLREYDSGISSPFPKERLKITLPRPLKLRAWEFYDESGELIPNNTKIND